MAIKYGLPIDGAHQRHALRKIRREETLHGQGREDNEERAFAIQQIIGKHRSEESVISRIRQYLSAVVPEASLGQQLQQEIYSKEQAMADARKVWSYYSPQLIWRGFTMADVIHWGTLIRTNSRTQGQVDANDQILDYDALTSLNDMTRLKGPGMQRMTDVSDDGRRDADRELRSTSVHYDASSWDDEGVMTAGKECTDCEEMQDQYAR